MASFADGDIVLLVGLWRSKDEGRFASRGSLCATFARVPEHASSSLLGSRFARVEGGCDENSNKAGGCEERLGGERRARRVGQQRELRAALEVDGFREGLPKRHEPAGAVARELRVHLHARFRRLAVGRAQIARVARRDV